MTAAVALAIASVLMPLALLCTVLRWHGPTGPLLLVSAALLALGGEGLMAFGAFMAFVVWVF